MKKIVVSALVMIFATASFATAETTWTNVPGTGPAVAGDLPATATGQLGVLGSTAFSVSTNVTLIAAGDTGGYNVGAKHLAGDTGYVSSSVNAGVEEVAIAKAVAITADQIEPANSAYEPGVVVEAPPAE